MDYVSQEEQLRRRQEMMRALMQNGMQGQVNSATPKGSLAQAISNMAQMYMGMKGSERTSAEQGQLAEQKQAALGQELQQYMKTSQGAPGGTFSDAQAAQFMGGNNAPVAGLTEPAKADPQKAVLQALASRFPQMQQIGSTMMTQMAKPAPKKVMQTQDGTLIDETTGEPMSKPSQYAKKPEKYRQEERIINGKRMLVQIEESTGKMNAIGSEGTTVNVGTGKADEAGMKMLQEGIVKDLLPDGASGKKARTAAEKLHSVNQAIDQLSDGASTGTGEELIQVFRGIADRLGIENAQTTPTAALSALLKKRVVSGAGGLGSNISNADVKYLNTAEGDLSTNKQALKILLAAEAAQNYKFVNQYNAMLKQKGGSEGFGDLSMYEIPGNTQIDTERGPMPAWNIGGNDPEFADMMERALTSKPISGAIKKAAPVVPGTPQAPGQPAPTAQPAPAATAADWEEYLKRKRGN